MSAWAKTRVAIVDTGVANAASVLYALQRLSVGSELTQDPDVIAKSTHVVLPGVGTAKASMEKLEARGLKSCLAQLTQPVLGICLGMQLLFEKSEEGGAIQCLGILPGVVRPMKVQLAVPHMGWNQVRTVHASLLMKGIPEMSYFYFVHSYIAPMECPEIKAVADYEIQLPAVVEARNWLGTQFHPERSGDSGQRLLRNFIEL